MSKIDWYICRDKDYIYDLLESKKKKNEKEENLDLSYLFEDMSTKNDKFIQNMTIQIFCRL